MVLRFLLLSERCRILTKAFRHDEVTLNNLLRARLDEPATAEFDPVRQRTNPKHFYATLADTQHFVLVDPESELERMQAN